ncbi:hypothetical protein [Rothia koreensis]|uniref:hypothetical protein n=1 Tax=Rothia koreensis TaxID=592378 RepID=UPI003FCE9EA7
MAGASPHGTSGGWNGGWNGGQGGPGQGGSTQWSGYPGGQAPRKKNFFTTTAGILSIIGAILLVLIVALVLVLAGIIGKSGDPEESQTASSYATESSTASGSPQASGTGSAPSGSRPDQANIPGNDAEPVETLSGEGDQRVKTDKLKDGHVYYAEYWFEGESNFAIWGMDDKGEDSGLYANDIDTSAGSSWINLDGLYGNPKGFHMDATEGSWEVKLYDKNAIQSEGDKPLESNGTVAYVYQGPKKDATFENLGHESFEIEAYDLKGNRTFHENVSEGQKKDVSFPDATKDDDNILVQVRTTHVEEKWKMSYR